MCRAIQNYQKIIGGITLSMLFFIMSFLSVPVLIYFMVRMLMSKVKKAKGGKKNYKKKALITTGVMIVSFMMFISLADTDETEKTKKDEPKIVEVAAVEKQEVEKEPELAD